MADTTQFTGQFETFQFKLTSVTEDDLVEEARATAKLFYPRWDSDKSGDIGMFVLRLYIKALSQGINLANAWAQEFNIFTARERTSIIAHARRIGFTPASVRPARVEAVLKLVPSVSTRSWAAGDLQLTTRAVDGPANEVFFENEYPFSVGSGVTQVIVPMVAGKTLPALTGPSVVPVNGQPVYTGDGTASQSVVLPTPGVLDGSVSVSFGPDVWTQVTDFVASLPTDFHFITRLNTAGLTQVLFGDGSNGARPENGVDATITYRVGGGDTSNIPPHALTFIFRPGDPLGSITAADFVSVDNPLKATGGQAEDTNDQIITKATANVRLRDFIGTVRDAATFAGNFDGVARASASLLGNFLTVFIIPAGGGSATTALKTALLNALTEKVVMGYGVSVSDAPYFAPNASTAIHVRYTTKQGYVTSQVTAAILADIKALLNPLTQVLDPLTHRMVFKREPGQTLHINEIRSVLSARPEIEPDFKVLAPLLDITLLAPQFTTDIGAEITVESTNNYTVGYLPQI